MKVELLDHGYCELVETWGSDQSIIEAARMSTNKGFLGWGPLCCACNSPVPEGQVGCHSDGCKDSGDPKSIQVKPGDEKLLKYLYDNKHSTPFEMAGLTIEVQAPIFVFREWHRHRVPFGYNEMSARYTPLPNLNYVPTIKRLMMGAGHSTKQAGTIAGSDVLTEREAQIYREQLEDTYSAQEEFYQKALKTGVPKELARIHLPVGRYSRMRATANLRGWLGFLTLRLPKNAQYEIRVYAEVVGSFIKQTFPRTWELFDASVGG